MLSKLLVLQAVQSAEAVGRLSVDWASDGATYEIKVDGDTWFSSGPTFTTVGSQRFAVEDGSLVHQGEGEPRRGEDKLGAFSSVSHSWLAGSAAFETLVLQHDSGNT